MSASNVATKMKAILKREQEKHPDLALAWLDSSPDALATSTQLDGWKVLKGGDGVVGEVRVGDLVLGGRPKEVHLAEVKEQQERTNAMLSVPKQQFEAKLAIDGGGGRYLQPLSDAEANRKSGIG
jgi:hypothetical protein